MPDRRGKSIKAGDKVIYHGASGLWFGIMKYDEDERKKFHIFTDEKRWVRDNNDELQYEVVTVLRYFDKWPNGILNMSAWEQDILDTGRLDLPEPI